MLIITRRPGERLMIGDDVVIEVLEVSGSSVRIGIAAPKSIPVYREEIYSAVKAENTAAAAADPGLLHGGLAGPARATPAGRSPGS